jgi:hypothetical protein
MVFNTQNYWVFGHFPSSGILENTTFRKQDLFPSSGEGGGEDTYSVGPLRKCLLAHLHQRTETDRFRNVVFSRIADDGKVQKLSNSVSLYSVYKVFLR